MADERPHLLHLLRIDTKAIRARVDVNGFEIFSELDAKERLIETKINHLIIQGQNQLTVSLGPELDDEFKPKKPTGLFRVMYMVAEHGKAVPPDALRRSWRWPSTDPEVKLDLPGLVPAWTTSFEVSPEEGYGRWAWQDGVDVELTDRERNAVGALVVELRDAFAARDVAALQKMLKLKHQELSRALDVPMSNIESGFTEAYSKLFQDVDGVMNDISPVALLLRKVAGGRAIHVTTQAGGPAVTGTWNKQPFRFAVTVSKLKGQWVVVR